jgi:hypothetical protein
VDVDRHAGCRRRLGRSRCPALAAASGQDGKAQSARQIEAGDRLPGTLKAGMRHPGARPGGGPVMQLRIIGLRGFDAIVEEHRAAVAVAKLDAVRVELVVAQLDGRAQRRASFISGNARLEKHPKRLSTNSVKGLWQMRVPSRSGGSGPGITFQVSTPGRCAK